MINTKGNLLAACYFLICLGLSAQIRVDVDHVSTDISLGSITVSLQGDAVPVTVELEQIATGEIWTGQINRVRGSVTFTDLTEGAYGIRVLDKISCSFQTTVEVERHIFDCSDIQVAITEYDHITACGDRACIDGWTGVVGSKKFAYDIWGDTVNVASRMETNAEKNHINISQSTYELIKEVFDCEHRGEIDIKNRSNIGMYYVRELI